MSNEVFNPAESLPSPFAHWPTWPANDNENAPIYPAVPGADRSSVSLPSLNIYEQNSDGLPYSPARKIPLPEKNKGRSTCYFLDPIDTYWKAAESQFECNGILRFVADREVTAIEPQFDRVSYLFDGKQRSTVFDLRASYGENYKSLVACKPLIQAAKLDLEALLQAIADQLPEKRR